MTRLFAACAFAGLACIGTSATAELAPGAGHSVHLDAFDGVVYYTVEQDGFRVVATLALGTGGPPLRVTSTLAPGQRMVISVPRSAGQPPNEFKILRDGETLVVSEPVDAISSGLLDEAQIRAASGE